jgi:hypothetical protein
VWLDAKHSDSRGALTGPLDGNLLEDALPATVETIDVVSEAIDGKLAQFSRIGQAQEQRKRPPKDTVVSGICPCRAKHPSAVLAR